ncbi:efflux RND transporter periplasmic adaptor subunit [Desulfolucanica intricata]|uniref:efflux RND transporter periplasmic adaptor subunit n=1 Tax=Desulfolucanica intricata TaxID=1285191 RepID=UPI00083438DC|nr:efflux RND transporter periplasmic adaptor subunit [Desulfolucanica intricata]
MLKNFLTFLMITFLVLGLTACGNKEEPAKQEEKSVPVETVLVKKAGLSNDFTITGEILPDTDVQVAPKITGRVTSVLIKLGDYVNKGQVLFTLEDTDYRSNFDNAAAAVKVAQANYDQANKQYERMKILFNEGAIASAEMDQAETARATAAAQLEQAQVGYNAASENLSNAVIVAPVSGQVAAVNIEPGEIAGPQAQIPPVAIVDMNVVKVKINLSENLVSRVKVGQKVEVFVESLNKSLQGTVSNIAPKIDSLSRAFPAEIKIPNPSGELRGGMVAKVKLLTEEINNALVIPTEAVIEQDRDDKVFIVEKGTAKERSVTTGISNEKYTQITSGLKIGEEVIVKGNRLVGEGQKVNIVKQNKNGGAGK